MDPFQEVSLEYEVIEIKALSSCNVLYHHLAIALYNWDDSIYLSLRSIIFGWPLRLVVHTLARGAVTGVEN